MYKIGQMPKSLELGYIGENLFRTIEIDMSAWVEKLPGGVPSIIHIQPGKTEADAYIADTSFDTETNVLSWTVTDADLGTMDSDNNGEGEIQIWMQEETDDDSVTKCGKSIHIASIIHKSATEPDDTPPAAQTGWMEAMTALKTATVNAAEDAADAKDDAVAAKEAAEDAQEAAEAATVHQPTVGQNGNWYVWNQLAGEYQDTQIPASGDPTILIDDTSTGLDKSWSAQKSNTLLSALTLQTAPIVIASSKGEKATFPDGSDGKKIENLKIQINPLQEGTGDPAPDNVRNISGRTGLTVYQSGENTSDPTEKSVSWQDEAGTVYHGTNDAITGTLTDDSISITFDGSDDEEWTYQAYNESNKYRYYIDLSRYGVEYGTDRTDVLYCNWLKPIYNGGQSNTTNGYNIIDMTTSRAWLFIAVDIATVDLLKAALASTPLVVVIRLSTPVVYNINDKLEISTLNGINNIWSNVGEVLECKYRADTKAFIEKTASNMSVDNRFSVTADTLTDDTIKAFEDIAIRKNLDIEFCGDITSFTSLTIGHGINVEGAAFIVIDDTYVTVKKDSGTQVSQYAHGLTIGTYLRVAIHQADNLKATVIVATASGQNKKTDVSFNGCYGDVFATVSGTMTDVSLTAVMHDLNKPIWFFGDSYQSLDDSGKRYPYYMRDEGYLDGTLFCGKFGAFAYTVLPSFRNLIKVKKPSYIVWGLGMNGSDSGAINEEWKRATDEVIATCEEKNITLILATIPNTPTRDNTYKNAYVKSTGLRYIDFAKAVGAESAGSSWTTGMLDSDDLHPTETGAIALYAQLLKDFTEVMQSVKRSVGAWEGGSY